MARRETIIIHIYPYLSIIIRYGLLWIVNQLNLTIENLERELSRTYLVEELNKMKDKKSFLETLIPTT